MYKQKYLKYKKKYLELKNKLMKGGSNSKNMLAREMINAGYKIQLSLKELELYQNHPELKRFMKYKPSRFFLKDTLGKNYDIIDELLDAGYKIYDIFGVYPLYNKFPDLKRFMRYNPSRYFLEDALGKNYDIIDELLDAGYNIYNIFEVYPLYNKFPDLKRFIPEKKNKVDLFYAARGLGHKIQSNKKEKYTANDLKYKPALEVRDVLHYSDFDESNTPYSFFIADIHGEFFPIKMLYNLLISHKDIQILYLECPPKHPNSDLLKSFFNDEIDTDNLFNKFNSGSTLFHASKHKDEYEGYFKRTFELIKEKVKAGNLKVECIDNWDHTALYIVDRFRRNQIMASNIDIGKNSIFLCGGEHFEGEFAIQNHIKPELNIYLLYHINEIRK